MHLLTGFPFGSLHPPIPRIHVFFTGFLEEQFCFVPVRGCSFSLGARKLPLLIFDLRTCEQDLLLYFLAASLNLSLVRFELRLKRTP